MMQFFFANLSTRAVTSVAVWIYFDHRSIKKFLHPSEKAGCRQTPLALLLHSASFHKT
jgi:hypothetical protein